MCMESRTHSRHFKGIAVSEQATRTQIIVKIYKVIKNTKECVFEKYYDMSSEIVPHISLQLKKKEMNTGLCSLCIWL